MHIGMLACVCMRVSTPEAINNQSREGTPNNEIMKFYGYSVSIYDTAIDKLNKQGLSNTAAHERLPKKRQVMQY